MCRLIGMGLLDVFMRVGFDEGEKEESSVFVCRK